MRKVYRLVAAVLVCAMLGIGTVGCNTFRGMGRDIQRGGEEVEDAADNVQYGDKN